MKKRLAVIILVPIAIIAVTLVVFHLPSKMNAQRRLDKFVKQVNYGYAQPQKIYAFLNEDYKKSISEADFVEAFNMERSYPYLTPFYINFLSLEMAADQKSGVAHFSQAARLGGMFYDIPIVYENFNYYFVMEEYEGFSDGSYLVKFERIPNYLINGWDLD